MLKNYDDILLFETEASEVGDWSVDPRATHAKVTLPSEPCVLDEMHQRGFCFGDRTIGVSISLKGSIPDGSSRKRIDISFESGCDEAIFEIARKSFIGDSRFYVTPGGENQAVAEAILTEWVACLGDTLVCRYKDEVIGFLALAHMDNGDRFIHLAAVDERYRLTGAAVALYSAAIQAAKEAGSKKLEGRISSRNVSVMNLYASFGAKFGSPYDVFFKELKNV